MNLVLTIQGSYQIFVYLGVNGMIELGDFWGWEFCIFFINPDVFFHGITVLMNLIYLCYCNCIGGLTYDFLFQGYIDKLVNILYKYADRNGDSNGDSRDSINGIRNNFSISIRYYQSNRRCIIYFMFR